VTRSYAAVADDAARRLAAAGFAPDEARTDAGVLVRAVLGWTTETWLARLRDPAPDDLNARLDPVVVRRARREPVAYLTGEREFYGRAFRVTPDVLIPRPETELVVEAAIQFLAADGGRRAADIGTGSGCIAVSIACERPDVGVIATDVSAAALTIARDNATRHGAGGIRFVEGSLLAGQSGPFDAIVSNPPYIARADRASLPADVRDYEPAAALFGGDDGLDVIRGLIREAAECLRPGGALIMEIGAGQADAAAGLLRATRGFADIRLQEDLQGIPRVVIARRRG
jgi:release factor glutamine methyltransferase